ncbi:MAG: DUF952 domain-containing protein [Rhodobacteraceae bacterium]|nr:DUF952 domain-containing protein [Paracoccaceae bacterium]
MHVFKILRPEEWAALHRQGETAGAPIDVADGYVHFSTAAQLAETAARHFAGAEGLMVLAASSDALGAALKWEVSRGGAEFPHLYRALRLSDAVWVREMPLHDGRHVLPEGVAP